MLKISKDKIYLTRGDNAEISVSITYEDGAIYIPQEGDKVIFRMKSSVTAKTFVIEKELTINTTTEGTSTVTSIILDLEESDTKNLKFTNYRYEIELVTAGDRHYTVIENGEFEIGVELEVHNG